MSERAPYPSETAQKVLLRMPDGMRDRLADVAKANNRSMNAEIVARLEESFVPANRMSADRANELAEQIVQRAFERVQSFALEADARIKALEEENRALKQAGK